MSRRLQTYTNFNKGVNKAASKDSILPEELIEGINITLAQRGGYAQRLGCTKAITESLGGSPIKRLLHYPDYPLAVVGNSLVKWDGTVISSALNSGEVSAQFFTNTKLYLLDGAKYWVYDGSTLAEVSAASGADLTPIKRCKFLIQRGQRMYALGDPQNPNQLYFSATGEPNNFTTTQVVKAITDDEDILRTAIVFKDALVVFKDFNVYTWTGWDPSTDVKFDLIDTQDGSIAPRSVVRAGNYILYLGSDAILALVSLEKGVINTMRVSPGITDIIKSITNRETAVGVYHKGEYLLACCTDGTGINNVVLRGYVSMAYPAFEEEGGNQLVFPWTIIEGWKVSDWYRDNDGNLYYASATNGMIYKAFDGHSDDGVAITSVVQHRFNLQNSFSIKKLKRFLILARQYEGKSCTVTLDVALGRYSANYTVEIDDSGQWDISEWDNAFWDWEDVAKKEIPLKQKCDRVEITITHNELDEPMTIYGFGAEYKLKKPKGVKVGVKRNS